MLSPFSCHHSPHCLHTCTQSRAHNHQFPLQRKARRSVRLHLPTDEKWWCNLCIICLLWILSLTNWKMCAWKVNNYEKHLYNNVSLTSALMTYGSGSASLQQYNPVDYCDKVTGIDEISSLHIHMHTSTESIPQILHTATLYSIICACDYKCGCMLHKGFLCAKAILWLNKRSDNSIIQSVNIWSESGLAGQSEGLNRFRRAH